MKYRGNFIKYFIYSIIFVALIYLNHFISSKIGMIRFFNYLNLNIEKVVLISNLKWILFILSLIFSLFLIYKIRSRKIFFYIFLELIFITYIFLYNTRYNSSFAISMISIFLLLIIEAIYLSRNLYFSKVIISFLKRHLKLILFIGFILIVILLDNIFGFTNYLKNTKNLMKIKDMVENNFLYAVLIYLAVTILSSIFLALPGVTFAIFASILFGPYLGTIVCTFGATLGAMGAFLIGRYFLRDSLKPKIKKSKYLEKYLFDEKGKNQIFVLMITRLLPIFPFNLQNFLYGITDISFVNYSIFTFLFILPGTFIYTVLTSGILEAENRNKYLIITAVAAILLGTIVYILNKKLKKDFNDE